MSDKETSALFEVSGHNKHLTPQTSQTTPRPRMKRVERNQMILRAVNVEKLIKDDHPARAIWEFVGRLDLNPFSETIQAVEGVAGRSATDPKVLICVWIYAYSQGIGSAREIERLFEYHPAFQWLTGMDTINHHTLSDFRIHHKKLLDELFAQVLGLLSAEGLITLERVMHDGTKIRASAGADSFRREEKIRAHLKMATEHIQTMDDPTAPPSTERVKKARERALRKKKDRLELALKELEKIRSHKANKEAREQARVSQTDPEARIMKQANGGYGPSYNVQISTDRAQGIIVGVETTQDGTDVNQLVPAIETIENNMGEKPKQMVADGGFTTRENILGMNKMGVDFFGSMQNSTGTRQALFKRHGTAFDFYADKFSHHPESNTYTCPAGKVLTYQGKQERPGAIEHRYQAQRSDCSVCTFQDQCCPRSKAKRRMITIVKNNPVVEAFISKMETPEAKEIYRERGPTSEFPNAWIKEKMGLRQFRLRGLSKVKMESVWACLTYNIKQWIRLKWKPPCESLAIA